MRWSARRKARISGTLLLLLALWPLVHRQLVVRYEVDPWRLFGFAMYCTPHHLAVNLIDRSGPQPREIFRRDLPASLRPDYDRFVSRRKALGALESPDPLARELLAAMPELTRLTVATTVSSLPFAGSEIDSRTTLHHYARSH
jgi:hypothetical protein